MKLFTELEQENGQLRLEKRQYVVVHKNVTQKTTAINYQFFHWEIILKVFNRAFRKCHLNLRIKKNLDRNLVSKKKNNHVFKILIRSGNLILHTSKILQSHFGWTIPKINGTRKFQWQNFSFFIFEEIVYSVHNSSKNCSAKKKKIKSLELLTHPEKKSKNKI